MRITKIYKDIYNHAVIKSVETFGVDFEVIEHEKGFQVEFLAPLDRTQKEIINTFDDAFELKADIESLNVPLIVDLVRSMVNLTEDGIMTQEDMANETRRTCELLAITHPEEIEYLIRRIESNINFIMEEGIAVW